MGWLDGATIRGSGDSAVVIEYGEAIDEAVGRRVGALTRALDHDPPPGLIEAVPSFRSVLLLFDPDETDPDRLLASLPPEPDAQEAGSGASWRVPVCLEEAVAEDLAEAAGELGLGAEEVRERLLASRLQVGMYGFAPGYAYLSGIDPALAIPRRPKPRSPIPAGSIIIAGGMAVLASVSMPTGWYVVGRTALKMFDMDRTPMVPFAVGDRLTFASVSADELETLRAAGDGGLERLEP